MCAYPYVFRIVGVILREADRVFIAAVALHEAVTVNTVAREANVARLGTVERPVAFFRGAGNAQVDVILMRKSVGEETLNVPVRERGVGLKTVVDIAVRDALP